jgi:hypothetical protein
MTRRHTLLNRRAYTTQKVTVQCHELFCRCLSYDWGRASSGHLLHSPGERLSSLPSPHDPPPPLATPSYHQHQQPPEEETRSGVVCHRSI